MIEWLVGKKEPKWQGRWELSILRQVPRLGRELRRHLWVWPGRQQRYADSNSLRVENRSKFFLRMRVRVDQVVDAD